LPASINPAAKRTQIRTRQFYVDARCVEIARENKKLVGRLESIARGLGGVDPRAPPPQKSFASSGGTSSGLLQGAGAALAGSKSLNDLGRKKMQKDIDHDNASLVRRILATGSTMDRKAEERAFQKHKRAGSNLRKMNDSSALGGNQGSQSTLSIRVPNSERFGAHKLSQKDSGHTQLRVPRQPRLANNSTHTLQGLDTLMFLGELPSRRKEKTVALEDGDYDTYGGEEDTGPGGPHGEFGHQRDEETARRSWLEGEDEPSQSHSPSDDRGGRPRPPPTSGDVPVDEEWDDDSFDHGASPAGDRG